MIKKFVLTVFTTGSLLCNAIDNNDLLKAIPPSARTSQLATFTLQTIKDPQLELSLKKTFLQQLKNVFGIQTFVETGTYHGLTTRTASGVFKNVYTVDLSEMYYQQAKILLGDMPNIHCFFDDSAHFLQNLLPQIKAESPLLFWLDAHCVVTPGGKETPIVDELATIKAAGITNAIIMIDDIRFFYKGSLYPPVTEVIRILLDINKNYQVFLLGDILVAYPGTYEITVSPVTHATTLSRLFYEEPSLAVDLVKEEEIIARAPAEEADTIHFLCSLAHHNLGYRAYYLWDWLILNAKDPQAAAAQRDNIKHIPAFQARNR